MIKKHLNEIRQVNLNQQTNSFKYKDWVKDWVKENGLVQFLLPFKKFEGKKITRNTVNSEFKKYWSNPKQHDIRHPFLLCMIWGYEGSGLGPSRTKKYFTLNDTLTIKLRKCINLLSEHNIKEAFAELLSLKQIGTSFGSKFLYFAGKAVGCEPCPLIFDNRVASALIKLSAPTDISRMVSVTPKKGWDSYNRYFTYINKLAKLYNLKGDKIETFLFNYGVNG